MTWHRHLTNKKYLVTTIGLQTNRSGPPMNLSKDEKKMIFSSVSPFSTLHRLPAWLCLLAYLLTYLLAGLLVCWFASLIACLLLYLITSNSSALKCSLKARNITSVFDRIRLKGKDFYLAWEQVETKDINTLSLFRKIQDEDRFSERNLYNNISMILIDRAPPNN
uniref:Uncharacterized protein n=1 Tax=Glossina pallidipes TaxID=7398 RepID=A0A1B0AAQ4_GLOPL